MSRANVKPTQREGWRFMEQKLKKNSPCGRPPSAPANPTTGFDRDEGGRGTDRMRLWGKFDEVTTDTSGSPVRPHHYKVVVEYSANTTNAGGVTPGTENGTWKVADKKTIPAKEDTDDNTVVKFIHRSIKRKLAYRWYVVAVANEDGCKSTKAWQTAAWVAGEVPPAPTNVRIFLDAKDRIALDWDDTPDPTDNDRRRDDQSWFIVEWSTSQTFATTYRKDRKVHRTAATLKVPNADEGLTFYGRVRAVNDHGDEDFKSSYIPATSAGNSNPGATATGAQVGVGVLPDVPPQATDLPLANLTFDSLGPRHNRVRALANINGFVLSAADWHTVQMAHADSGAASPPAGTKRVWARIDADGTGDDELTHTFKNIPRGHRVWVRHRGVNAGGPGPWSPNWTSKVATGVTGSTPGGVTGLKKDKTVPRRIRWTWTDPNDEVTTRWKVRVLRAGTQVFPVIGDPDFHTRTPEFTYRVPEAHRGVAHTIEITPMSELDDVAAPTSDADTDTGTLDGSILAPGTLGITPFASSIRPVQIVSSLPTLPDTAYPQGATVFLTTDNKLYRSTGTAWTAAVPTVDLSGTISGTQIADNAITTGKIAANTITAADIAAGTITATEIAANTITAGQIATGAISADEIAADAVEATHINVATLSAISANMGTITAGTIYSSKFTTDEVNPRAGGTYIEINGASDFDKIKFVTNGGTANLVATGGGLQIGGTASQELGFWGEAPIARPGAVTGDRSADTANVLGQLLSKLHNIGLIVDNTTA